MKASSFVSGEIAPNFVLKNRMIKAPRSSWPLERGLPPTAAIPSPCEHGGRGVAAIDVAAMPGTCGRHIYMALTTTGSFPA